MPYTSEVPPAWVKTRQYALKGTVHLIFKKLHGRLGWVGGYLIFRSHLKWYSLTCSLHRVSLYMRPIYEVTADSAESTVKFWKIRVHSPLHNTVSIQTSILDIENLMKLKSDFSQFSMLAAGETWLFFWYLVKSDLSSVDYCSRVHRQVTFYKVAEKHGHV